MSEIMARFGILAAFGVAAVLSAGALSACASGGQSLAYRSLTDIPPEPKGTITPEERNEAVRNLEADRARAAQAAESLRQDAEKMTIPTSPSGT